MSKTKCLKCDGKGIIKRPYTFDIECVPCQGTGVTIAVATTSDLSDDHEHWYNRGMGWGCCPEFRSLSRGLPLYQSCPEVIA